jgi:hypothetical protein
MYMGNTAHVYDTFAPQFTDRFHAIGITPRGFGASSRPTTTPGLETHAYMNVVTGVIVELKSIIPNYR